MTATVALDSNEVMAILEAELQKRGIPVVKGSGVFSYSGHMDEVEASGVCFDLRF
jgi:hypothetical protein